MKMLSENAKVLLLGLLVVFLHGCSSMKESDYVPKSPETLSEWLVEGSFELKTGGNKSESHFYFKQIDENYELAILGDDPVGKPKALISGNIYEPGSEKLDVISGYEAEKVAQQLKSVMRAGDLSYWVRGLPATANAQVEQQGTNLAKKIQENGWKIYYHDFMSVTGNYKLPAHIKFNGDDKSLRMDLVRAETGYLTNPCSQNLSEDEINASVEQVGEGDVVTTLVPRDGTAPLPRWIDEADFCKQLLKIHGDELPDSRVGLYGPDSMMWRLSGMALPGSFGAGRSLLLQVAHPWVTAGIDEHSVVRNDPLGRARRTFYHILSVTYGSMPQVMASANQVRDIHEEIEGHLPEESGAFERGSEYRANEINAMIWVHATLWETIVHMYEKMEEPLTQQEKDRFYEETKLFAMLFGIPEQALPADWNEFMEYNRAMWNSPQLTVTPAAMQLKKDLFKPQSIWMIFPMWGQEIITSAELPPRIREEYDMKYGWWQKMNYAWMRAGAWTLGALLPKDMERQAVYHEAMARLEGEKLGGVNQFFIEAFFDKERLVN